MTRTLFVALLLALSSAEPAPNVRISVVATTVTLNWDAVPDPAQPPPLPPAPVQGYWVSYGTASKVYTTEVNVANNLTYVLTLDPTSTTTYYFAVQAYNVNGRSAYSSEVNTTVDPGTVQIPAPRPPAGPPVVGRGAATTPIKINYQPAPPPTGIVVPPVGYLPDWGLTYGPRNGQIYGWNVDNSAQARARNSALSQDKRYDTFNHLQNPANPTAFWEIAVPNGSYSVRIVCGDPLYFDSTCNLAGEGVTVVSGATTAAAHWRDGTAVVSVTDGRLTIRPATGSINAKINFIEITPQ